MTSPRTSVHSPSTSSTPPCTGRGSFDPQALCGRLSTYDTAVIRPGRGVAAGWYDREGLGALQRPEAGCQNLEALTMPDATRPNPDRADRLRSAARLLDHLADGVEAEVLSVEIGVAALLEQAGVLP